MPCQDSLIIEEERDVHAELLDAWKRLDQPLSVALRSFLATNWETHHHELALDCISLAREKNLCSTTDTDSADGLRVVEVLNEKLEPVRNVIATWKNHRK